MVKFIESKGKEEDNKRGEASVTPMGRECVNARRGG